MDITLFQAIMISLFAGFAGLDYMTPTIMIQRPIIIGVVVGYILGDVTSGTIAGATIELSLLGLVPIAGAQPPNPVFAGVIGSALAIMSKLDPQAIIAIAFPFAILGSTIIVGSYSLITPVLHLAQKNNEKKNFPMVTNSLYIGMIVIFLIFAGLSFFPVYFGSNLAKQINSVANSHQWIIHGLIVAGGMMPAIGFSIILQKMLKTRYLHYAILGYVLSAYLKLPVIAIVLFGVIIAIIEYQNYGNKDNNSQNNNADNAGI